MYLSGATIKEKIHAPLVSSPLSTMLPEHVLKLCRAHCLVIDVQPNFSCVIVSSRLENINRIVSAACRFAVMVEYSIELVMRWL
jgi:hypothetical protein